MTPLAEGSTISSPPKVRSLTSASPNCLRSILSRATYLLSPTIALAGTTRAYMSLNTIRLSGIVPAMTLAVILGRPPSWVASWSSTLVPGCCCSNWSR